MFSLAPRWLPPVSIFLAILAGGLAAAVAQPSDNWKLVKDATGGLDVLPFPGTPDASPQSQITFPAVKLSQLKAVDVRGSKSGTHPGRLVELAGKHGAAFVPSQPFTAGETVSVTAMLSTRAAGAASGAPNSDRLAFSFAVASTATTTASPPVTSGTAGSATQEPGSAAIQSFQTEPNLSPPAISFSGPNSDRNSGDIFVDAQNGKQSGPMILDSQGRLVWFRPLPSGQSAFDFRVQSYQGHRVLTWWQGTLAGGHGVSGEGVILDSSYRTVATVHASEGYSSDLHEFQITSKGTALITAYEPVGADLSSVGGPRNGTVLDSIVQEVDIKTGHVLWEWHAFGHVPLSASHSGQPTAAAPFDFFHINSVQLLPDGNFLVSGRNTWAVYEISRRSGQIIWQLGGKSSSFQIGAGAQFEWQHDARLQPSGSLTLFDNGATPTEEKQSRALELEIDTKSMSATLKREYTHTPSLLAGSQGNMQILPNGNVVIGWGQEPDFSEYTRDGRQVFTAHFPGAVQTYRAYRFPWTGQPATRPAISVRAGAGQRRVVFASWNGATGVARWQVLAGTIPDKLLPIAETKRSGFETVLGVLTTQRYLAIRALDSLGHVLGTSTPVAP